MTRITSHFLTGLALLILVNTAQAQQSPPQPQEQPKVAVVRFLAPVDAPSIGALLTVVDNQYKAGIRRFVILLSSPGGDVLSGLMAYNYLKGLPIELTTFNVGNVDSAAGMLFCAGAKRYAVPESRFVIHEVSLTITSNGPGNLNIDLPSLESQVAVLKSQEMTIARILASTVGKPQADAEAKIHAQKSLSAEEAKQWGLVQDIRTQLFDPAESIMVLSVPPPTPNNTPGTSGVPTSPQFSYSSGAIIRQHFGFSVIP
jgi:ATP-dependent Clp protease protease subunit